MKGYLFGLVGLIGIVLPVNSIGNEGKNYSWRARLDQMRRYPGMYSPCLDQSGMIPLAVDFHKTPEEYLHKWIANPSRIDFGLAACYVAAERGGSPGLHRFLKAAIEADRKYPNSQFELTLDTLAVYLLSSLASKEECEEIDKIGGPPPSEVEALEKQGKIDWRTMVNLPALGDLEWSDIAPLLDKYSHGNPHVLVKIAAQFCSGMPYDAWVHDFHRSKRWEYMVDKPEETLKYAKRAAEVLKHDPHLDEDFSAAYGYLHDMKLSSYYYGQMKADLQYHGLPANFFTRWNKPGDSH